MQRKSQLFFAIVLLCTVIAGYVLVTWNAKPPSLAQENPPPTIPAPTPAPVALAPAEPVFRNPLETEATMDALPEPGKADALLLKALDKGLGKKWLALIVPDELIRHIVATVDNLPRKVLPASVVPLKRVQGTFAASGSGDTLSIDSSNSLRYAAYVQLIQPVDSVKLVSVYRRFYPLFQSAYADLGYPKAYFNDRLVEAIDDLLAAPDLEEPARLVHPKVLYEFADPELQARSAGQKILIRLGRDNAAPIKAKLREIRQQVARAPGA